MEDDRTRVVPPTPAEPKAAAAAPRGVQLGEVLGHTYRIEALLGRGGMGVVYRARHVVLDSEHAIKIILSELSQDPQVISLLNHEARTLRTVKNEAIVEYEGLMLDEFGRRYLVMEFVDGPSLPMVLKDRRFSPDEVRRLRDRLARGLAVAHDKGVFHRDISPDNIILPGGSIDQAKIIDFGIAKSSEAGERTIIGGDFAGKYSYASPEQAGMYGGKIDGRSDIYSLALVLASAAIGYGGKLDMGSSPGSMIAARERVPDLSRLPEELRDEIAAMLQPRPEQRPQSMRDLVGLDAVAARTILPRAGSSWTTRRRGVGITVAAISFAAVVAIGSAYFLLFARTGAPGPSSGGARQAVVPAPVVVAPAETARETESPNAVTASPGPLPPPIRAEPPAVDRTALLAQIQTLTAGYRCADVDASLSPDNQLQLKGFVSSQDDLAKLRAAIGGIPVVRQVADNVAVYVWPHCEMVKLLRTSALPPRPGTAPLLQFNNPNLIYRAGDTLVVRVTASAEYDGYLYVDYLDTEGNIVHMLPMTLHPDDAVKAGQELTLGAAKEGGKGGQRVYEISKPFGPNLVVAISSPQPLFPRRANEVENAGDYLPVLTRALEAAAAAPGEHHPVAAFSVINTVAQ
jgi:eukaryotic-like serine/threonine-protein kinase